MKLLRIKWSNGEEGRGNVLDCHILPFSLHLLFYTAAFCGGSTFPGVV